MKKQIAFKSGLHELDNAIGGFRRGSLTVLAGRPSMGKESFVRTIFSNEFIELKGKRRALYGAFSPGFKQNEFLMRLDCAHARIWTHDALQWKLHPDELRKLRGVREKYYDGDWFKDAVNFAPWSLTSSWLPHLKRCLRSNRKIIKTTVFFADFRALRAIVDRKRMLKLLVQLKAVAAEFNIPIIVLCGIPRDIERKDPPVPALKDLQLGKFERYVDKILILYRETYYVPNDKNLYKAQVIIGKNSDGKTGAIEVKFDPLCGRFDDI